MSVVTFYGSGEVETAQTTSMAGIATYLSLEQNYRILLLNTKIQAFKNVFGSNIAMLDLEEI